MARENAAQFQRVCRVGDIPEGEARMFVVAEQLIGVFHVAGEHFALDNLCPHAGASLAHGLIEGATVRCRIHHWRFSLVDGAYLDEDKPQCNARTFPVRVVNDQVLVAVAMHKDHGEEADGEEAQPI